MTKKYIYILFSIIIIIILLINNSQKVTYAFKETYNDYDFNNYILEFKECDLSTNNFIEKLSYFNDKDYKILEIIPYRNYNIKYKFYSNNLKFILDEFKNEYIDIVIDNDTYVTNICIKNVKINTANIYILEYKEKYYFNYEIE